MADKVIVEKAFKPTEAVEIIKSALLSGTIQLSGPNHPQFRIPQMTPLISRLFTGL